MTHPIKAFAILSVVLSLGGRAQAQYWAPIGDFDNQVRDMTVDPTSNLLYACGAFKTIGDSLVNNIAVYDGTTWDNVGMGCGDSTWMNGYVVPFIEYYDGKLFSGGQFQQVGGVYGDFHAAQWNGSDWVGCGNPNSQSTFNVVNSQLFALGRFDTISGKNIRNIARRDGSEWEDFGGGPPFPYDPWAGDVVWCGAYYRGSYYFGGNFEHADGYKEIMGWDGTQWFPLGLGLLGEAEVFDMIVYKGLLFVAGDFVELAGNAGSNVMAWDGEKWLDPFPNVESGYQIWDLEIIDDVLYLASGSLRIPGKTGIHQMAKYDGTTFCVFGLCLGGVIGKFTSFQGRLFTLGGQYQNSPTDSLWRHAAEWIGGNSTDTCITQLIGVDDAEMAYSNVSISPNPGTDHFVVSLDADHSGDVELSVCSLQGRVLMEQRWPFQRGANQMPLDLSELASGIYFVHLEDERGMTSLKLVKQ